MNIWQKRAPGVLLCLAVALLAWFLVELAPAMEIVGSAVLAILFGMVLGAVMKNKDKVKDGVAFTSKKVLQLSLIHIARVPSPQASWMPAMRPVRSSSSPVMARSSSPWPGIWMTKAPPLTGISSVP